MTCFVTITHQGYDKFSGIWNIIVIFLPQEMESQFWIYAPEVIMRSYVGETRVLSQRLL